MTPKPMTWLLTGAALTLFAGAAIASEQTARREAAEDAAKAQPRSERGDVRIHRHSDGDHDDIVVIRHGGREDHLKDVLQLRSDQEPALKAFLEATRSEHGKHAHMVKFERDADRTTLQRLDEMQAKLAEQQAEANGRIAAIRTFYGQLDATQKKTFDDLPMLMMVGPSMGPMMIPAPMHLAHRMPLPPKPPLPPEPPAPPRP